MKFSSIWLSSRPPEAPEAQAKVARVGNLLPSSEALKSVSGPYE